MTDAQVVYQFKITLKSVRPPIWRRFLVEPGMTLHDLHLVINEVMGWSNYHLHEFDIQGERYGAPGMGESWSDLSEDMLDERKFKLGDIIHPDGQKFHYSYDFGDGWEHDVVAEQSMPKVEGVLYPICIGGARACPPEDCGGTWGYQELFKILKNPNHPEYEEKKEWAGLRLDPERFDVDEVNTILKHEIRKQLSLYRPKRRVLSTVPKIDADRQIR